jgi:hypothetical protein
MTLPRTLLLIAAFALPLTLAACGDDEPAPAPESWAPLHYEYLNKLRLNVGSIEVQDHSAPLGDNDVSAQSPVPPAQAAEQVGRDRLVAAGFSGSAAYVVDQASITRNGDGVLNGTVAVHIDVVGPNGATARAEMHVGRQHVPGSDPENLRNVLYGMTKAMMDDLNVELEYQLRRSMGPYLVTGDSVPAKVEAAPLQTPGAISAAPLPPPPGGAMPYGAPPAPPPGGEALPPATPAPEQVPGGDGAPPPQEMSPPPGFLQLPPAGQPQPQ